MKVSAKFFWFIFILILLLPFSIHWRLFIFGEKTEGQVVYFKHFSGQRRIDGTNPTRGDYPVIEFTSDSLIVHLIGPDYYPYPIGKKITVFYNTKDPTDCFPLNIPAIYLGNYALFPGVLLLFWIAFYVALKQTQYLQKKKEARRKIHW